MPRPRHSQNSATRESTRCATRQVAGAEWCLFLDVDGTLLDFAPTPDAVHVDPSLRELLHRVRASLQGAVALVSGRPLAQLDALFGLRDWPAAGLHGIERRDVAGHLHVDQGDERGFATARSRMREFVDRCPGALLEDKALSLALHYRGAPAAGERLRREVNALAASLGGGWHVLEGNMVLELRPQGATKADAIRAFLAEPPFRGRRPMFLGDDVTDVAGFAEVERVGGLSVAVGDRVSAMLRAASPRDVRALLEDLVDNGSPLA